MVEKYLACEASAGTGKTFTLSIRYVALLLLDVPCEKILALTFTNKASKEMLVRISKLLEQLANNSAEIEKNILLKLTSLNESVLQNRSKIVLKQFLAGEPNIQTIDKFFNQILRSFSLYGGMLPDFKISKIDDQKVLNLFLKSVLNKKMFQDLINISLIEEKKLSSIVELFELIYNKNVNLNIKKSANYETILDLEKLILDKCSELKTVVLRSKNISSTLQNAIDIERVDDLIDKSWLERDSLNYKTFAKCYTEELDDIFIDIKELLKEYFNIKESFLLNKIFALFCEYKNAKEKIKKNENILDFNDVTTYVHEILKNIDNEFLYFRLDTKIEHLLIDEFQDTSTIQYEILKPIIDEIISGYGAESSLGFKSFFYVGDTKQSIYSFRGGDYELFDFVSKKYGLRRETLDVNYRSSKSVVAFTNTIFSKVISNFPLQKTPPNAQDGYVEVCESEDVFIFVEIVKDLLNRGAKFGDIAILVYNNDDVIKVKYALLENIENVSLITDTSKKLINYPVVEAIIFFIKYIYFQEPLYLANFKSIIGVDYSINIDITKYHYLTEETPKEIILKIVNDFELFLDDDNLIQFIEIVDEYQNIEEFVYLIDKNQSSIISGSGDGINILTIHKSKGLEYKNVIVLDRFKAESHSADSLIVTTKNTEFISLNYRYKGRSFVDEEYKIVLEREKDLKYIDKINVMYVAFTRAKNELYIVKKPKSTFDILDLNIEKIGKKSIYKKNNIEMKQIQKIDEIILQNYGKQILEAQKTKEFKSYNIGHIYFGNAVHFVLEIIREFDEKYLNEAIDCAKNSFGNYVNMNEIQKRILALLKNKTFIELTKFEYQREVSINHCGHLLQIDLLIKKNDFHYIVVDYKSGGFSQEYEKQLSVYKDAVLNIYKAKIVEKYLCFIEENDIELKKLD